MYFRFLWLHLFAPNISAAVAYLYLHDDTRFLRVFLYFSFLFFPTICLAVVRFSWICFAFECGIGNCYSFFCRSNHTPALIRHPTATTRVSSTISTLFLRISPLEATLRTHILLGRVGRLGIGPILWRTYTIVHMQNTQRWSEARRLWGSDGAADVAASAGVIGTVAAFYYHLIALPLWLPLLLFVAYFIVAFLVAFFSSILFFAVCCSLFISILFFCCCLMHKEKNLKSKN